MTLRTVALLARRPGLLILDELLRNPAIELCRVYTHLHLPKAESPIVRLGNYKAIVNDDATHTNIWDPEVSVHTPTLRPEYVEYVEKFPAVRDDVYAGNGIGEGLGAPFDLLLCCNWRKLIGPHVLSQFKHAVNIHRGDLPKYPGARPILQALGNGDEIFAITAHQMTAELDAGTVLRKEWWQSRHRYGEAIEDAEARIRSEMEHLYAPLVRRVLEWLVRNE